jgi:alcohol dehydrogenase
VEHSSIPVLASEAARQWTASFNPRPVGAEDFIRLYEAAWENAK